MRKLVLPFLIIASLGASSAAMAATMSMPRPVIPIGTVTKGVVKLINAKACTVTLTDRRVFQFAPKCDFSKLKVHEKVAITSLKHGKIRNATAIVALS